MVGEVFIQRHDFSFLFVILAFNSTGNVEYDNNKKNRVALFSKVKTTKMIACEYFQVFLMVHVYSTIHDEKTLTVHRKQHNGSKSVVIFSISTMFFLAGSILICIFLHVPDYSVMTYSKKILFFVL
jgi:hypothetical protein